MSKQRPAVAKPVLVDTPVAVRVFSTSEYYELGKAVVGGPPLSNDKVVARIEIDGGKIVIWFADTTHEDFYGGVSVRYAIKTKE
jgi:uncharacterized OB-fold protein